MAGIFASLRVTKKKLAENKILFQGAGEVSSAVIPLEREGGGGAKGGSTHLYLGLVHDLF